MQTSILGATSLGRGELPAGAGIGYVYDWLRQRQRKANEQRKKSKKLKKKIKKLTKGRKKEKRREKTRQSEAPRNGLRRKKGITKESNSVRRKVPGQNDSE
jgi:hypothetical protein